MYAWIWRHLPFGTVGKSITSAVLVALIAASLWFWGFPKAEPLLPFDDVNVTNEQQSNPGSGPGPAGVDPSESLPGDGEIPYSTTENQPTPSKSPSRR